MALLLLGSIGSLECNPFDGEYSSGTPDGMLVTSGTCSGRAEISGIPSAVFQIPGTPEGKI